MGRRKVRVLAFLIVFVWIEASLLFDFDVHWGGDGEDLLGFMGSVWEGGGGVCLLEGGGRDHGA